MQIELCRRNIKLWYFFFFFFFFFLVKDKVLLRLIRQAIHCLFIISDFSICEICFLCSAMTHNDIHIIIDGSKSVVGVIKVA